MIKDTLDTAKKITELIIGYKKSDLEKRKTSSKYLKSISVNLERIEKYISTNDIKSGKISKLKAELRELSKGLPNVIQEQAEDDEIKELIEALQNISKGDLDKSQDKLEVIQNIMNTLGRVNGIATRIERSNSQVWNSANQKNTIIGKIFIVILAVVFGYILGTSDITSCSVLKFLRLRDKCETIKQNDDAPESKGNSTDVNLKVLINSLKTEIESIYLGKPIFHLSESPIWNIKVHDNKSLPKNNKQPILLKSFEIPLTFGEYTANGKGEYGRNFIPSNTVISHKKLSELQLKVKISTRGKCKNTLENEDEPWPVYTVEYRVKDSLGTTKWIPIPSVESSANGEVLSEPFSLFDPTRASLYKIRVSAGCHGSHNIYNFRSIVSKIKLKSYE